MTPERYAQLDDWTEPQELTLEELAQGWHWCLEMGGLLCIVGGSDCFCIGDKREFQPLLEDEEFKQWLSKIY